MVLFCNEQLAFLFVSDMRSILDMMQEKSIPQVPPRFELGSQDSES